MITRLCRAAVRLLSAHPTRHDPCTSAGHIPPDRHRTVTSSAQVTDDDAMQRLAERIAAGASPWDAAVEVFRGGQ